MIVVAGTFISYLEPILLTRIIFIPSMDKELHPL